MSDSYDPSKHVQKRIIFTCSKPPLTSEDEARLREAFKAYPHKEEDYERILFKLCKDLVGQVGHLDRDFSLE